ncbi:MAG: enoyl-CoA hydratase/isomerase family protein, partial [Elusimicrobia bacterium]|nr:enoyl-CoA hydratase/isomerase family protein [Elusimicrobiota bacterium]
MSQETLNRPDGRVHAAVDKGLGILVLDRPEALNALSYSMFRDIRTALRQFAGDASIQGVLIKASGERAFCSGGDVKRVFEWIGGDRAAEADEFFKEEYSADLEIRRFPKPVISMVHGIAMGGGLGVARASRFLVAREDAVFAMPEAKIGFFGDVGASHLLPEYAGKAAAKYLMLTGISFSAAQAAAWKIADAVVSKENWHALEEQIKKLVGSSEFTGVRIHELIKQIRLPRPAQDEAAQDIGRFFGHGNFEEIIRALESSGDSFAKRALELLTPLWPESLWVTDCLIERNAAASPEETYRLDFEVAARMIRREGFVRGVKAVLVDKDRSFRFGKPLLPVDARAL